MERFRRLKQAETVKQPTGSELTTPIDLLKWWYSKGSRGVFLGYQHGVLDVHQYFGELVSFLPELGVNTIYLEQSKTWQPDFEHYIKTGEYSSEWGANLNLARQWWGGYEDCRYLFEAVRKQGGIRLVFIDCEKNRKFPLKKQAKDEERDKLMARELIKHHQRDRYLIICGASHAAGEEFTDGRGTKKYPLGKYIRKLFPRDKVSSAVLIAASDYKTHSIYKYFNNKFPPGSSPIAYNFSHGELPNVPAIREANYYGKSLNQLFSGLIFFPHARYG